MKIKKYLFILTVLSNLTVLAGGPNNAWAWGENETEAKGNWLKMEKLVKQKQYDKATHEVKWLLSNTPSLNVALYINAIKVYEKRASREKNATRKIELQDSTLMLYKKRIELFGNEAKVLNREGRVAWNYLSKRKGTSDELYQLYAKIYELNKNKTLAKNMSSYMKSACTQYVNKKITTTEVLNVFSNCSNVFDAQENSITNKKKLASIEKYRGITSQVFSKNVQVSCEDIEQEFGQKLEEKQDLKVAKLIISISLSNKCTSSEVFAKAGELLSAQGQSNYALEKLLGNTYLKKEENEKAITRFQKAITLTEDSANIGKLHLKIGETQAKLNQYSKARTSANEALKFNSELTKPYTLIGDLYFQSASTCSTGNKVQDRSAYIAAYKMYKKAGANAKAAEAHAQFPSTEEMFLYNQKPGDVINTGCWISESVKLESR